MTLRKSTSATRVDPAGGPGWWAVPTRPLSHDGSRTSSQNPRSPSLGGQLWLLLRQPRNGQLAQLVVDQGQERLGRLWVARLDGREDAGDFTPRHGRPRPPRRLRRP